MNICTYFAFKLKSVLYDVLSLSFGVFVLNLSNFYSEELTQMEMSWYAREMRRRPLMISTCVGNANERKRPSRRGRTRGGPRSRKPEPVGQQEYEAYILF